MSLLSSSRLSRLDFYAIIMTAEFIIIIIFTMIRR